VAVFPTLPNPLFPNFGPPTVESVPTAIARGPDGALYVGELTGFPFVQGLAKIYRVVPGQAPGLYCAGGFKAIMETSPSGRTGISMSSRMRPTPSRRHRLSPPNSGRLSRVGPGCSSVETLLDGLDRPTAVAVGADGAIYVTNHGVTAGAGEVLMLAP